MVGAVFLKMHRPLLIITKGFIMLRDVKIRLYIHEGFIVENEPMNEPLNGKREEWNQFLQQFSKTKRTNSKKILNAIQKKNYITKDEIAEIIGASRSTVGCYLKELKSLGIIERTGSKRDGYWCIEEKHQSTYDD